MDANFDIEPTKMEFEKSPRRWYTPRNTTHVFLQGFAFVALATTILLVVFSEQVNAGIRTARTSLSTCPADSRTPKVFAEEYPYQTFDATADKLWDNVLTPNGGFIIDETRTDSPVYGIAMFHQLHCVQMFRNDFQELYARIDGRSDGKDNVLHHLDERHLLHCLDYLRQVFLCYADGSIEPTMEDPHGGVPKTDGMVPHLCNNPARWYELSLNSKPLAAGHSMSSLHGHDHGH